MGEVAFQQYRFRGVGPGEVIVDALLILFVK